MNKKHKYTYHAINDKKKEVYSTTHQGCWEDAIIYFSKEKRMNANEFLKIYKVTYVED